MFGRNPTAAVAARSRAGRGWLWELDGLGQSIFSPSGPQRVVLCYGSAA